MSEPGTYATAKDVAGLLRVSLQEVYRRACAQQWRRTATRPVGYHLDDVFQFRRAALDRDRPEPRECVARVGSLHAKGRRGAHRLASQFTVLSLLDSIRGGDSAAAAQRARHGEIVSALRDLGPVVYAVLTKDGLIKFGYSANLANRLQAYGIGPRNARRLLMVKPGSRVDEAIVLERFTAHVARGREYFRPAREIFDYINLVRAEMGVPALPI